ncbi:hypothetical protein HPB48_019636 [Haemaphysalis longicornis]|uniref:G-protein coupled receptors family 1 profile domain-containing protein n=1 Tax=Haemaphysalis longicornis TaxID=44386 RepID=A0A9J6H0H9_HAELO|nr:hypothetical protein HPB48_019636 [Haemaphysalis longicornis]
MGDDVYTAAVPGQPCHAAPCEFNRSRNDVIWHREQGWPGEEDFDAEISQDIQRAMSVLGHLYTFFIPLLIILGLVGNGLSFVTFLFTRLRVRASSFYLGTLALSDFGYLFLMAFVWLDKLGVKMLNRRGVCQGILYLSSAFSFWSVWLTVTFTAERCLAVQCPLWRLKLNTRGRARTTVGATAAASLMLNSYLLLLTDVVVDEDGVTACTHRPDFEHCIKPFYGRSVRFVVAGVKLFIILNLPSYVVRIHVFVLSIGGQPVPELVLLLQRYFMLLYYTNFAVNIILYTLGSRFFRRMMVQYVCSKWSALRNMFRKSGTYETTTGGGVLTASFKMNGHPVISL